MQKRQAKRRSTAAGSGLGCPRARLDVKALRESVHKKLLDQYRIIVPHYPRDSRVATDLSGIALAVFPRRGVEYYDHSEVFDVLRAFNQRWLNVRAWPPPSLEPWAESCTISREEGHYLSPYARRPDEVLTLRPYAEQTVKLLIGELGLSYSEVLCDFDDGAFDRQIAGLGDDVWSYVSAFSFEHRNGRLLSDDDSDDSDDASRLP